MSTNALVINYENTAPVLIPGEVACQVEHSLAAGQYGINRLQDGPRELEDGNGSTITSRCRPCFAICAPTALRRNARLNACIIAKPASWTSATVEEMSKVVEGKPNSVISGWDDRKA
ncbi:MAG: hypothetical protein V8S24_12245 [Gordonibacter pamelaeae]